MSQIIDYQTRALRPFSWRRLMRVGFALLLLLGFLFMAAIVPYRVDTQRICQECGMIHRETHYFGLSFLSSTSDVETPVYLTLQATGHLPAHVYRYVFMNENGRNIWGGYYCGLGSGGPVYGNATDPRAAILLEGLYRSGQVRAAESWRTSLLDLATARKSQADLTALDVPFEPFATAEDFRAWQSTHMPLP